MSKLLSLIAVLAAALALLVRHYHHLSAFYTLLGIAALAAFFAVIGLRRHPVAHFIEEMRRLAD